MFKVTQQMNDGMRTGTQVPCFQLGWGGESLGSVMSVPRLGTNPSVKPRRASAKAGRLGRGEAGLELGPHLWVS